MPHITIDYSPRLADAFDRQALLRELHPMVLEEAGSAGVCKTLCRPAAETCVGDPDTDRAGRTGFVHITVALLPGRSDDLKARLAEDVLALLGKHLPHDAVSSVEVRDLAASYRLRPAQP
ncbi:5-carboxymethyl-2-hydroxymuconate Delta-isomerase [Kitasatospora sp. NPDC087314]|uniref:5-carboxymethyl-2-hydroxymuconate Delta-isomerase n=1 Tax=Kitasatospora sp. NPDC087314 TaxID=3364068 RepID=UPI0038237B04